MKTIILRTLICKQLLNNLFSLIQKCLLSELNLSQGLQSEASPLWCDSSLLNTVYLVMLRPIAGKNNGSWLLELKATFPIWAEASETGCDQLPPEFNMRHSRQADPRLPPGLQHRPQCSSHHATHQCPRNDWG